MKEWFHVLFIFMYVSCKPKSSEISTTNVFVFLGLFSADGVRALPDVSHVVRGERRHEQGPAGKRQRRHFPTFLGFTTFFRICYEYYFYHLLNVYTCDYSSGKDQGGRGGGGGVGESQNTVPFHTL